MPFYSDPGYYYGGGYQLYSPYYTPSTLYSPYNSYSRSLGGTYVVPSSRVNLSSSRYKPKLSTISETPISCRNSGLIPLTRIQSPKVSYHSSPYFKPPRPIPINTSDIDVSSAKYKRHEQRDHNDSDHSNIEPPIKPEKLDNNNNNVDQNFPSNNAEQDEGNTSKRHCSTIKRNRAVVRLSIIRRRSSEEKRKNEEIEHRTIVNSTQKPIIVDDQEKGENISWRDRFRDDLVPQQREVQRKSPGDRLREKYLIPDKQKDEGRDIYDDDDENGTVPVDLTKSLVFNQNNAEDKLTLNVEETLRRLSLPKLPSFHDICQDISSDKIDDDLNAGSLRRRASIIQEQEAEIINQLQKSGSGTFQYILERVESQEDCRQSTNRKSKKVKKIRHKITATVQIDNPKLERIIPELPEDSQNKVTSVEPKLKAKIETIEEDQTIHKIFKLPKKKLKATSNSEQSKKDKTLDNNEQEICLKCVSIEKQPVSPTGPLVFMEPIATPNSLLSPEGSPKKQSMATSASSRALTPLKNHIEEPQHFTFEMVSAKSKPAYIKSAMTIESPISPKTLQKIEETRYTHPSSKGTLSGNERLEENDSKTSTVQKVTKPSKISDDSLKISLSEPQIIKSEAIMKLQKSDNEEDFWATIDSRESLYMANRKSNLLKQQAATKTDMTENTEVTDLKESQQFEKPKAKSHSQNTKIPKETNVNKKMSREEVLGGMCEAIKVTVLSETVKTTDHSKTEHGPKYASISTGAVPAIGTSAGEDDNRIAFKGKEDAQSKCDDGLRKVSHLADSQKHSAKAAPSQAEAIQEIQSTRNSSPQDISSQKDAKINTGLKLKSAEIHTGKLTGRDTRDTEMPLTENDAFTTKKASSPGKKARKSITLNSEIVATHELLTIAKGDDSSIKEADANPSESKESGRREESGDSVVKQQSNTDHQQNDKIRKKKTGSPHKGTEKQSGPEKLAKKPSPKKQGPPLADRAVPPVQGDVKSGASNQQTEIISTRADCKSKNFDTCDIFGGDINDAITPNRIAKDEFESIETAECKLSKFPTVSNLNRCLQDVDAELDDYYPSEEKSSYDSSEDEDEDGDSMKKKNRDKKKEDKFDPNKVIKLDHKKKCYVKEEAPPYPLIATPRPLWKREKFQYLNDSNSESEESESDSECTVSEESCDELNPNKDSIIRMSTCSNDSGFEGGTAPSSPRKMLDCDFNCHKKCEKLTANLCGVNQKLIVEALASVKRGAHEARDSPSTLPSLNPAYKIEHGHDSDDLETSYTFAQFQKSGRITAPATIIPRFKKYSVEDFHFLAVLGKGSFGKVLLAELRNTEYYYAVKCLKKDVVLEDDDVECTLIERKVLALGTKHPYLCHLFCTFQTESHLFFVMEYLNGGDLMFHIQQTGRFSEPRAKFYAAEIISGLKFLHKKGIIYRDLKLDNVLLDFDGHVRIADFGMCKLQIYLDKTADSFCGTPDYMAPEIIKGEKYNQNVDWWSFGVLLYEMLIGQSPFSGCDEDELFWSICNEIPWFPIYVSQEAVDILKGLLEKDSSKRIGSQYSLAGEICGHSFFSDIDWGRLDRRELEPPFKPQVKHPLDTQYFDKAFTRERVRLTPIDKEILQSMDQEQFQGFSYTNPNATLN